MKLEQWKDIINYEGFYKISNFGNVKSVDRYVNSKNGSKSLKIGRIKKAGVTNGYRVVLLSKFNKEKGFGVHRLVAMHFIENIKNKPEVNHKDGNRLNNHVDNLEWCTSSENSKHSYENKLQISRKGSDHHNAKISEKDVLEILKISSSGFCKKELAKRYNLSYGSIVRISNRSTWKHVDINTIK